MIVYKNTNCDFTCDGVSQVKVNGIKNLAGGAACAKAQLQKK